MSTWIESHQDLRSNPKTRRAARALGTTVPAVMGHLHCLWHWALDHAEDGDVSSFDADDLADAAGWEGDPDTFLKALIDCGPRGKAGFIEPDGLIGDPNDETRADLALHDWWEYAGKLVASRRHAALQKRKHRDLYNDKTLIAAIRKRDGDACRYCAAKVDWRDRRGGNGATYDYVDPFGNTTLENIVVACRSCNAGKNQRTPEQCGYRLLEAPSDDSQKPTGDLQGTEHNLDQQYRTEPNRTEQKGKSGSRGKPRSPRATRLPDGWRPEPEPELVEALGGQQPAAREFEKFCDYWRAKAGKDGRKADWQATWRNWLRRAGEGRGGNQRASPPSHAVSEFTESGRVAP